MYDRIFHFADLHIRKGSDVQSRYDEYKAVFNRTLTDVQLRIHTYNPIAVICGDVFHDKLQISPPGIRLFFDFVRSLSNMMPVIIIQGNHDMLQEMEDKNNDLLEAFVQDNLLSNVHYLRDTGVYDFENLEIGVVSIRDLLKRGASVGACEQLPSPPVPRRATSVKIMLAHCTLASSTGGGAEGVSQEYFCDWSFVLLGDIHKRQVIRNEKSILGYSGSLIQQHFGESVDNHGYLLWDTKGNVEAIDVIGEVGYIQLYYGKGGVVSVNTSGDHTADHALSCIKLPRFVRLRIVGSMKDDSNLSYWIDRIRSSCEDINISYSSVYDKGMFKRESLTNELRVFDLRSMVLDCIRQHVSDEFLCPSWERMLTQSDGFTLDCSSLPTKLCELVQTKNANILKNSSALHSQIDSDVSTIRRRFRLEALHFKWLLAFGKQNVFNFQDGVLRLINAPNGFGKSAFFECIILGLFGESFPSRGGSSLGNAGLINRRRPSADSCNVCVRFRLDEDVFTITRTFSEVPDSSDPSIKKLRERKVALTMNDTTMHTGSMAVKRWVHRNLGSSANYMLFGMISQGMDHDLLKMKPKEQAECLDEIFGVSYLNGLYEYVRSVNRIYKDVASHIRTHLDAVDTTLPDELADKNLGSMEDERASILERIQILSEENDSILIDPTFYPNDPTIVDTDQDLDKLLTTERELLLELKQLVKNTSSVSDSLNDELWIDHEGVKSLQFDTVNLESCQLLRIRPDEALVNLNELEKNIEGLRFRIKELNDNCPVSHGRPFQQISDAQRDLNDCLEILQTEPPHYIEQPVASQSDLDKMEEQLMPYKELLSLSATELDELRESSLSRIDELESMILSIDDSVETATRRTLELNSARLQGVVGEWTSVDFNDSCECCIIRKQVWEESTNQLQHLQNEMEYIDDRSDNNITHLRAELLQQKDRVEAIAKVPHLNMVRTQLMNGRRLLDRWIWYNKNKNVIEKYHNAQVVLSWWTDDKIRDTDMYERNRSEHTECVNTLCLLRQKHEALLQDVIYTRDVYCANKRITQIHIQLKTLRSHIGVYAVRKTIIKKELKKLHDLDRGLYSDINTLNKFESKRLEMLRTGESMRLLLVTIGKASRFIEEIEPTLKQLKAIVFERHILPSLVNEANWLLQRIFGERHVELRFEFRQHVIYWYVMDEGNAISTDKLSGAQHFAVGLCMRLALSSLGVSKMQCEQLFIDEGFCGFDSENLRRVPELLHGLKRMFTEITIVSHLEEIRGCVDEVITIKRSNGISTITKQN